MKFRAELTPVPFPKKIAHADRLLLIGSCFTSQIGAKLAAHKFRVLENPNGILFNPVSIYKAIASYAAEKTYRAADLFQNNELFGSWDHHSQFSAPDAARSLELINSSARNAAHFLKQADWVLITLGSAFLYERLDTKQGLEYENAAANCHKMPARNFNRRLLSADEVTSVLRKTIDAVKAINRNAKFIFTISPVRHLREGFVDNNRSKAALIQAVHSVTDNEDIFYFPAYELVIDDLRDYRFFAEDLAHPNYAATEYVFEKFKDAALDADTLKLMERINEINAAVAHKPFNPSSEAHKTFCKMQLEKLKILADENAYLDFSKETAYFTSFH